MRAYLAALPDGARSFPDCEASAELLLGLASRGVLDELDLPADIRRWLAVGGERGWLPEVVHVAVLLALRDVRFGGASGDHALIQWIEGMSRPLVVRAAPPERPRGVAAALSEAPAVLGRFHRGTVLSVERIGPRDADVLYRHPDGIFPPVVLEWRRRVLLAMLAGAGAPTPTATLEAQPGVGTAIRLAW